MNYSDPHKAAQPSNIKKIKLKIGSINLNGLVNNQIYLNKLILDHDILCMQETWCTDNAQIDNVINIQGKKIYHKEAKKMSRNGRPSGGLGFIVNKNLRVYIKHISDRISLLKINNLLIININMIYDDGSKENNYTYENDLMLTQEIYDSNIINQMEIILIGDMNVDFIRPSHNMRSLVNFVNYNNLKCIDIVGGSDVDYTYHKIINNREIKSIIEHIIVTNEKNRQ